MTSAIESHWEEWRSLTVSREMVARGEKTNKISEVCDYKFRDKTLERTRSNNKRLSDKTRFQTEMRRRKRCSVRNDKARYHFSFYDFSQLTFYTFHFSPQILSYSSSFPHTHTLNHRLANLELKLSRHASKNKQANKTFFFCTTQTDC